VDEYVAVSGVGPKPNNARFAAVSGLWGKADEILLSPSFSGRGPHLHSPKSSKRTVLGELDHLSGRRRSLHGERGL
jgi:hypothetical protein